MSRSTERGNGGRGFAPPAMPFPFGGRCRGYEGSGPGLAACVPARECLRKQPSPSSCVRVPCSGVGVAVSDNTLHVSKGRSRRKNGLALHRIAVQYARCIPLQCVTSPSVASRHSAPHRGMSGITCSASLQCVPFACARGSPHMEAILPQVFRLVCLAGAPVSMEMKCSVSLPVEMSLPLLRLSWANMQLVGSFVRPSISVMRKAFGAHS